MGRNIFHLSGGEKQKIACAGVSIMEPDVLVMDEPSSNLDASSILDLRSILAFWKFAGKNEIIVSEHRLTTCEALRIALFILLPDKWKGITLRQSLSNLQSSKEPIWDFAPLFLKICYRPKYHRKSENKCSFAISVLPTETSRKRFTFMKAKFRRTVL